MLNVLGVYERCSSHKQINRNKTTIFFSKSTPEDRRTQIKEAFGVMEIKQHEKYLGFLSFVGRKKNANFEHVKLNLFNYVLALFRAKFACNSAIRNPM